jgi:hypothetical protein
MPRLMMCLTCGKNFATIEQANEHNEYFRQKERETRIYLTGTQRISWSTNLAQMADSAPESQYIPAHVVQISEPLGVRG